MRCLHAERWIAGGKGSPRGRLRESKGADMEALSDGPKIPLLLVRRCLSGDHLGRHAMHPIAHGRGAAGLPEFLRYKAESQQAFPGPAEVQRHVQSQQPCAGQGPHALLRPLRFLVNMLGSRRQNAPGNLGGCRLQPQKGGGKSRVHQ
jgi:hypothetical protein